MAKKSYRFPYGVNADGTPKIQAKMSHEEYEEYKRHSAEMADGLQQNLKEAAVELKKHSFRAPQYLDVNKLDLLYQKTNEFEAIPYPVPSEPLRTVASHGGYQIIVHNIIKYFGKDVSVKDLTEIANFGCWQHDPNGTWRHFIDAMCQAYGLNPVRLGTWKTVYDEVSEGNLIVASLAHKMYPEGHGNALVLITGIENGNFIFYHPRFGANLQIHGAAEFMANTAVLWKISEN